MSDLLNTPGTGDPTPKDPEPITSCHDLYRKVSDRLDKNAHRLIA